MIDSVINILMLEDSRHDQELIKRQVKKAIPNAVFTVAMDKAGFLEKIKWSKPHLILSDYHLPDYNGLDALLYVKEHLPQVPFIFLSGNLSDEEAVARAILHGASAYVLKQNLKNLPEKIIQVYQDHQAKQARIKQQQEKQEKIYLHLQKAKALLNQSNPFPTKEEIVSELQQAMEEHQRITSNEDQLYQS